MKKIYKKKYRLEKLAEVDLPDLFHIKQIGGVDYVLIDIQSRHLIEDGGVKYCQIQLTYQHRKDYMESICSACQYKNQLSAENLKLNHVCIIK